MALFMAPCRMANIFYEEESLPPKPIKAVLSTGQDGGNYEVHQLNQFEDFPRGGIDWVARGEYKNQVNSTGWGFLQVETNTEVADEIQAHGAGYFEGYVTAELVYMAYQNTIIGQCDGKEALCEKIDKWLAESIEWMEGKVEYHGNNRPYWHHVNLFLIQMKGLTEGYNYAMQGTNQTISLHDVLVMNVFGDIEDLSAALSVTDKEIAASLLSSPLPNKVLGLGRCSALLRLLPGNAELLVSHDTWNSYQNMLRLMKKYTLPFKMSPENKTVVPGHTMSFSSYPGVIYSGDDFTIASSGLTILETTIGNSNSELWHKLKPQSVLEGIRSTVANRLATDGRSWADLFSIHNSGTYNNQWMVVDYNKFRPGQSTLANDLFWVLEQIPGYIQSADLTKVLEKKGFWPSYNSPYFKDVFNMSGNVELMDKFGDWFSYERTPRAKIFSRDAPNIKDMEGMIKVMRYNNYTQDPESACDCEPPFSAENAISARCDLNPSNGTYPFPALGHRSHGGTDMKITSYSMQKTYSMVAQSGPTWDPLPPFRWSEQDFKDTPHVGQPDLWMFDPVVVEWE